MFKKTFYLLAALSLVGSALHASFAPQVSEYFITEDADFEVDTDRRVIEYDIALRARKPLPEGSVIQMRFQNPASKGDVITKEVAVLDDSRQFRITSGNVVGLKLKKDYRIDITLFASERKQTIVGEHSQRLFFEVKKKAYKKEIKDWYESQKAPASSASKSSSRSPSSERNPESQGESRARSSRL